MIGVPPTSALSRLGIRLGERKARSGPDNAGLTQEDEENIHRFEGLLSDTLGLLRRENDALEAKDVATVASFFEEKAKLLETLERKQPAVEPFLAVDVPAVAQLRKLVRDLAEQLELNEHLLRGMADASRTILSEIEHLRSRQSLKGVYDKTGQLRGDVNVKAPGKGFERKF
ncbi:hypothetical protein [Neptunicoccus cionae]|uniref:hypothetical protein n=1 Tax=Neptunicoccus cionae TaxID=2035344 RepID=UPI000C78FA73|nr:hypothetical protein [Amylibacter cionae]PLS21168.1 hypothetical protein C0U40_13560 [Amylibacter cionae]